MSKLSFRAIALMCAALVVFAVPAFAGNNKNATNPVGGGPPACRDLATGINAIQSDVEDLQAVVDDIDDRTIQFGVQLNAIDQRTLQFSTTLSQITATLNSIQQQIIDIREVLADQGGIGLQADVTVSETACAAGAVQCASAQAAASSNQNPVALNVLVMRGGDPVTNLTAANFHITTSFVPSGNATISLCAFGMPGCGSSNFFVNAGNGTYQLWVSPTTNWVPGTYTLQVQITDNQGNTTTKLARIFIAS